MKKIMMIAATLTALMTSANATTVTTHCAHGYGQFGCTTSIGRSGGAAGGAARSAEDIEAERVKWVAFCKPVGHLDKYGVTRLTYAHEGCEFGRTH